MLSFLKARSPKQPEQQQQQQQLSSLSPLDIPLILDLIFSFLNTYTIRNTVVLVCRQWFLLHQDSLRRTVTCKDDWPEQRIQQVLGRLLGAYRLECFFTYSSTTGHFYTRSRTGEEFIRTMLLQNQKESLQEQEVEEQERRNRIATTSVVESRNSVPTLFNCSPLRELALETALCLDEKLDSFPYPLTLTRLELNIRYWTNTSEHLGKILMRCPVLEHLSIKTERIGLGQHLRWTYLENTQQTTPRRPYPLRSLYLQNVCFSQSDLENVLLLTPHLKALRLMSPDWRTASEYDWTRMVQYLKALGITLDTVHFSDTGRPAPVDLEQQLREICPTTSDWTLWASDMTPSSLEMLARRTSFVTTLELCWKPQQNRVCCTGDLLDAPRLLHDLLCTSPQLIHLKTLKAPLRPQYMDLFDGHDDRFGINSEGQLTLPSIWACRGLKTLHIELHGKFDPRVLFGYISRVLPRLQELYIIRPDHCETSNAMFLHTSSLLWLKGGFCLLSRLQHLERLCVVSEGRDMWAGDNCRRMEFSWILDSSSAEDKAQRQKSMEQGEQKGTPVLVKERDRKPRTRLPPTNAEASDATIWYQLRHLGLFQDVEEMVKEMDSKGFKPLPSLEKLSLSGFYLRRPEDELNALFPPRKWYQRVFSEE